MEEKNLKNTEENTTDKLVLAKDNTENMVTERQFLERHPQMWEHYALYFSPSEIGRAHV